MEIKILTVLMMVALITIGGIYISIYEKAPLGERIQVFAVGFGMYTGALLLILGL